MANNTYTITRANPSIDWRKVPVAPIDTQLWGTDVDISAQAQVCYDEKALYVHLQAVEKNIRTVEEGPTAMVNRDSCLEFFFSPSQADSRYFNIEFNSNCVVNIGYGFHRYQHIRILMSGDQFNAKSNRTEDGWEIFYEVPYSLIRIFHPDFAPVSGQTMQANFYKCGDNTETEHYICWNPITCETPDFHLPEHFGTLIFE